MKLRYFASVRECIGKSEEALEFGNEVKTVADLIEKLKTLGDEYKQAFEFSSLRIAVDQNHVKLDALITGAYEIAFFPPMTGG